MVKCHREPAARGLYYKTLGIRNVQKMDILLCYCLWLSMAWTNTLTYYIICPFSVHNESGMIYSTDPKVYVGRNKQAAVIKSGAYTIKLFTIVNRPAL